jgi:hypothetical protein
VNGSGQTYLYYENHHFRSSDINLTFRISERRNKYYIRYYVQHLSVTCETYNKVLQQELMKLRAIHQTAKQAITQDSVPIDKIIAAYLGIP